ncbi:MAG TPA: hypothetical protein PKN13_03315, partial [Accumulibacter sp.]|nr:hypothetical protein [Accumulibacter sp.]HMW16753.1 hypothetical protein [Accumulibacter sp.]HMX23683.1 hypothetical protein [Accumulibacter sp.]HNC18232.1 hypothetical protein [Accumulibacter sp.]HND81351.1 hypothetical protein [Accumulibacter sp.]
IIPMTSPRNIYRKKVALPHLDARFAKIDIYVSRLSQKRGCGDGDYCQDFLHVLPFRKFR